MTAKQLLFREDYIRWFSELGVADVPSVGGKNASLGEMVGEAGSGCARTKRSSARVRHSNQFPQLCAHGSAACTGFAGVPSSWRMSRSLVGLTWRRMLLTKARASNGLTM